VTGLVATFQAADFNDDGAVDDADLAAWQSNFGHPSGAEKSHGDADADGPDFLTWQRQIGGSSATTAAAAAPEPNSLLLAGLSFATAGIRLRFSPGLRPGVD
jgi:hypothetical protein